MDILSALEWRYATKRMTGHIVPDEKVDNILKAAYLAPSGIGLQPYEIIMISNQMLKEQVLPIAMNQPQIRESSHLLVFAVWDEYTHERIDKVFDYLDSEREILHPSSQRQRNFAKHFFGQMSLEENFHHAAKQANIALGLSIATAALQRVDACPMEGLDAAKLDVLLDLPARGLKSTMLLALGYRDGESDWNFKLKKVRKPFEDFVLKL